MSVGTAPTPVYAISVTNQTVNDLIVSYDDGSGARSLGLVSAGSTDRFVIASPRQTSVSVSGRSAGGVISGPVTVQLVAGQTLSVVLN